MPYKLEPEKPAEPVVSAASLHRLPAQALKGAAATLPGFAGDVAALVNDLAVAPLSSAITGQEKVPYEKTPFAKILPTTQMHTKALEEGIPYLKPKNKIERFVNDVSSDTTSLFMPAGLLAKAGLRGSGLGKSFLTSLGANSAGSFVSDITGDPEKGAYAKMGAMFMLSALNKPGAQKEVGKLYDKADSLLPQNATVNATNLESRMNGLKARILNGRTVQDLAPSEKFVVEEADKILRQIQNGQANVGTLKSAVRSLNENLTKMVYEAPDKATRTRARSLATQINHDVNSTLADYGKVNPEWWKAQKSANEGFATIQQSNWISKFIERTAQGGTVAHGLLHALGVTLGTAGIVPYQTAKVAYRIYKSPTLRKHYARVVSSAAAEDATTTRKELHTLDEEMQKQEAKKPRYRLED